MIEGESGNESDSTFAVRATAEGSKHRTITGAIKGLFRDAVKALLQKDEDDPRPKPGRRRGETEGEFRRMMRYLARRFDARREFRQRAAITSRFITIPVEARATAYLADTLDQFSQLDNGIDATDDYGEIFDANTQRIFPQP